MAQEKIIIKFEPKGHTQLIAALKAVANAEKVVQKETVNTNIPLRKLDQGVLRLDARLEANNLTWKKLGVSQATVKKALLGNMVAQEQLKIAISKTSAAGMFQTKSNRLLSNSFATLRSQMLLVSFGAMLVERALVSLVRTYAAQEAANQKLAVGLSNVQGNTAGVTQRLVDYSSALQQVTAFGDEAITTGMVQFTTFGLNEKAMKALTPQVLNVARAIQTVNGQMPDLNSLFIAFGKATTTGIGTLTRYGVVLTESERKQLAAMNANESAVKIAKILERQYGGLAAAYAKTTAGMLDAAAAARGDAAEAFGEVFAPAVLAVSQAMKVFFESLSPEGIKRFALGMTTAGVAVTGLAIAAGRLNVQMALNSKLLLRSGWGALVVILGLAVEKLLSLWGVFDDGNKVLADSEEKIGALNKGLDGNTEAQEAGAKALRKRLALLEAETQFEKELINLGHEASVEEIELIARIVKREQLEKDIARNAKELSAARKKLADIEKKAQQEALKAAEALSDELERQIGLALDEQIRKLREEIAELRKTATETAGAFTEVAEANKVLFGDSIEFQFMLIDQQAEKFRAVKMDEIAIAQFVENAKTEILTNAWSERSDLEKGFIDTAIAGYDTFINSLTDAEMTGKERREAVWQSIKGSFIRFSGELLKKYLTDLIIRETITKVSQASSIATATATGSALANVYAVPAALAATASFGAAGVAGTASIMQSVGMAKLLANASKFEEGGLVGGRRHSQGGTIIEAERGEYVMSRDAVESVGIENLNRMNQGGGSAISISVSGNVLSQDFVEGELADRISEAVRRGTDFGIK